MLRQKLKEMLAWRISSERADGMVAQMLCFMGAIIVVMAVVRLVHLAATTPFEILVVVLLDLLLAISLVILGIIAGRHANRAPTRRIEFVGFKLDLHGGRTRPPFGIRVR